jgi:hypothetical protein
MFYIVPTDAAGRDKLALAAFDALKINQARLM